MAQPSAMSEEQRKALEEKIKNMSPEELKEFQKQQCIFCQIIAGKVPAKKVYDDKECVAVMDINPAAPGHLLIMPKEHYAIMPQIPDGEIGHLFLVAKYLSQIVLKVLRVSGTTSFVANGLVAGQKAQHFMIHLLPRKEGDGLIEIEEKLLDEKLRRQVKEVVEKRFNVLMGIKKEVVAKEEQAKEPEEGREEPEEEKKSPEKKSSKSAPKPGKKRDEDDIEEDSEEEEDDKEGPEEGAEEERKDKGIDLDDIANLFK